MKNILIVFPFFIIACSQSTEEKAREGAQVELRKEQIIDSTKRAESSAKGEAAAKATADSVLEALEESLKK